VDHFIEVPRLRILSSLLCLIPLQLLANEISVCLDINPDKPRNLAKTVTV
jgi:glucosamine--fructose-6-phosphate aminotransferase (isomerizing)